MLPDEILVMMTRYLGVKGILAMDRSCRTLWKRIRILVREVRGSNVEERGYERGYTKKELSEMGRIREVLCLSNVQRVIGPLYVPSFGGIANLEILGSRDLEILSRNIDDLLPCIVARCLKFPDSSLIIRDCSDERDSEVIFRYGKGHLHLRVLYAQYERNPEAFRDAIRDLSFSSLCLDIRGFFPSSPRDTMARFRDMMEYLEIRDKKIEELVVNRYPRYLHPSFFPHLHTVRFIQGVWNNVDMETLFAYPVPTVTHVIGGRTSSHCKTSVYKLQRSVHESISRIQNIYPNLLTGGVTFNVTSALPSGGLDPCLALWEESMRAMYPHLDLKVKVIRYTDRRL